MKQQLAYEYLPQNYDLYEVVDLAADPKMLKRICLASLAIGVTMVLLALPRHPIGDAFDMALGKIIFAFAAAVVGSVVYVFLHEGVHGIFIRLFTGERATFGYQAGMAYAGSRYFFGKTAYIIIALAPIAVWGWVLAVILADVPSSFWWYLYAIQIFNISGGAGDLFVTWRILSMPAGVVAHDEGTVMRFYAPTHFAEE